MVQPKSTVRFWGVSRSCSAIHEEYSRDIEARSGPLSVGPGESQGQLLVWFEFRSLLIENSPLITVTEASWVE